MPFNERLYDYHRTRDRHQAFLINYEFRSTRRAKKSAGHERGISCIENLINWYEVESSLFLIKSKRNIPLERSTNVDP